MISKDLLTWLFEARQYTYRMAEYHLRIPAGELNFPLWRVDFDRDYVIVWTLFPVLGDEIALELLDYFPNKDYGLKIISGGERPVTRGLLPPQRYDKKPMSNITRNGVLWYLPEGSHWLASQGNHRAAQQIAQSCTFSIYSTETSDYRRLMVAPYQGVTGILIAHPEILLGKSLYDTSIIPPEKLEIHDRVCGAIVRAIREADSDPSVVSVQSYQALWEGVVWHKIVEAWAVGENEVAVVTRNEFPYQYEDFMQILSTLN